MDEHLVETWAIHNRIHLYMLEAISDEALGASLVPRSRTVYDIFAHVHNVRLMWLQAAAPELLAGLSKLEAGKPGGRDVLAGALNASSHAVENLLRASAASGGRVKGFKPHAAAFLGYLISHESHHRGQVTAILRIFGQPLDQKSDYGMWEWGVR